MPRADLPSSPIGWLVALAASMAGFITGLLFIKIARGMIGGS